MFYIYMQMWMLKFMPLVFIWVSNRALKPILSIPTRPPITLHLECSLCSDGFTIYPHCLLFLDLSTPPLPVYISPNCSV